MPVCVWRWFWRCMIHHLVRQLALLTGYSDEGPREHKTKFAR
jgi:hypothetical protein